MDYQPATQAQLAAAEELIEQWMAARVADEDSVTGYERDPERGTRRWVLRLAGEQKDFIAVWFTLGQRSLSVETYFMPAPEENHARLFEYLLRRNEAMIGFTFSIGVEEAVFLTAKVPVPWVDEAELDRLVGSAYMYTEHSFRTALRIGFESRFKG